MEQRTKQQTLSVYGQRMQMQVEGEIYLKGDENGRKLAFSSEVNTEPPSWRERGSRLEKQQRGLPPEVSLDGTSSV